MIPVQVRRLERRFGERVALAGIDLEVASGEIVGLVGPNGSGKTTLLKIVAGFLAGHGGDVRVFGLCPFRDQAQVMCRARFAFAPPALFDGLTAREHLTYLGALRGPGMPLVGPTDVERALDLVGLGERADERVRAFSFGMRQRLVLAQAMLPTPDLIVLDEPTDGLDPLAVLELREILLRMRDEHGLAILLSSHLLIEIHELVDRMLVLSEGSKVFQGAPEEMLAGARTLRLGVDDRARALALLGERGHAGRALADGGIELPSGALGLAEAQDLLRAGGIELRSFHTHAPSLEEALIERLRGERSKR